MRDKTCWQIKENAWASLVQDLAKFGKISYYSQNKYYVMNAMDSCSICYRNLIHYMYTTRPDLRDTKKLPPQVKKTPIFQEKVWIGFWARERVKAFWSLQSTPEGFLKLAASLPSAKAPRIVPNTVTGCLYFFENHYGHTCIINKFGSCVLVCMND